MKRELGGSQISALLESVPGIVNVLRSPVADALVGMIRAGAGIEPIRHEHVEELIQYAVRRGLIPGSEGEQLLAEVRAAVPARRSRARTGKAPPRGKKSKPTSKPKPAQGRPAKKAAHGRAMAATHRAAGKSAAKKKKKKTTTKRVAKKPTRSR